MTLIERPVSLSTDNTVDVRLQSSPNSGLTLEIIGVDNDQPQIIAAAVPQPNAQGWNNSDVTVGFTCVDATSGVASCTDPITVAAEGAGQVVTGTAVDLAGNLATANAQVNLDKTNPTIAPTIDPAPNPSGWNNTDVTVGFVCADGLSGILRCTAPISILSEGAGQPFTGLATDLAGNSSSSAGSVNVDATAPLVGINSPADGTYLNTPSITVTGTMSDALSRIDRVVCNGVPATLDVGTFSCDVTLVEGPNSVSALASDLAGNTASASTTVKLDTEPPTITSTLDPVPRPNGWNNQPVTVTFNCADAESGVADCTAPVTIAVEGADQQALGIATDNAGNTATATAIVSLDQTPPLVIITSPVDGTTFASPSVVLTGTMSDALSGTGELTCNGIPTTVADGAFSCDVLLVEGPNTITATGLDLAGNVTSAAVTINVITDQEGPSLTVNAPSEGAISFNGSPTIDLRYSDPSGVDLASLILTANGTPLIVDCQLSGGGGRCPPITPLADGVFELTVSIADLLGNVTSLGVRFAIDSEPVPVSIDFPLQGLITADGQVRVDGTAGPNVASVDVNGVPAALSGFTFSADIPLREGVNMLVAVATAPSGKTGTDSIDVTRDNAAPIVRIDSPRDGFVSVNDTIDVTGLVNDIVDGGVNATVTVNGQPTAVVNGTFMLTELKLFGGVNTITATAVDEVGNAGSPTISVVFDPPTGFRITQFSGNGQSAPVNAPLADQLVARVQDPSGTPAAGRIVTFEVTRNSGILSTGSGQTGRKIQVATDGNSEARIGFTIGDTAGEGNNRVVARALGVAGEVEFCASGLSTAASRILANQGDNQRGLVGAPLATPFEALVVDTAGNPVRGVEVTFAVLRGGGTLNGQADHTLPTDANGLARVMLTLGADEGISNNLVNASFAGLTAAPATFAASGILPRDPVLTSFRGVVLDSGQTPIPGATVSIPGSIASGATNAGGQFVIEGVPVGTIHLRIDPTTSPRPETFPPLEFETVTVAGNVNILGQPIILPFLDTVASKQVGGNADVNLTMTGVAGFSLTVFANSVTFPDGSSTGQLIVSQVHLDKVPMPPPGGSVFMAPAWTLQPAGVQFDPPIRVTIPNNGQPPGSVVDLFQFDHDLNEFISIGKGTVSEDGSLIESDPGFGVTRAGWGGARLPDPPPTTVVAHTDDRNPCSSCGLLTCTPVLSSTDPACCGGNPIDLTTEFCAPSSLGTTEVRLKRSQYCSVPCPPGETCPPLGLNKIVNQNEKGKQPIELEECPLRTQNLRDHENDGCSFPVGAIRLALKSPLRDTLLQGEPRLAKVEQSTFDPDDPAGGGYITSFHNPACDPKTGANCDAACDIHDTCYQTCGSTQRECDLMFHDSATSTCQSLPAGALQDECLAWAQLYFKGLLFFGEGAFENRQAQYCQCCP